MPDPIFDDPRLAVLYDPLEPARIDLDAYLAMVDEFAARTVLDVGCGTGALACLLAERGIDVVAVDPARASLDVARSKPGADRVRWLHGDVTVLPTLAVDLVTMTGNVAQVFLTDEAWMATLDGIRRSLRPGGHVVFETRDPARRGWERWTREQEWSRDEIAGVGFVEHWVDLVDVSDGFVTFRWTFRFETTGDEITSDSTLRFRERDEVERSLSDAGLDLVEVRDAPDRPGLEWVFVARRPDEHQRGRSAVLASAGDRSPKLHRPAAEVQVTFEPVRWPDDRDAAVAFLTSSEWPFHGTARLSREQAATIDVAGDDVVSFWIHDAATAIGLIRVFDLDDMDDGSPLFDLRLAADHRGRGIGTTAVRWLTGHLFTTYPQLVRIEATTRHDNHAMQAVFDRCGYRREGRLVEAWVNADGTRSDTLVYATLRREWSAHAGPPGR